MRDPSYDWIAEPCPDPMFLVHDNQACADEPEGNSNKIAEQKEINLEHLVSQSPREMRRKSLLTIVLGSVPPNPALPY